MTPTEVKAAFADLTSDIHNWMQQEANKVLAKMTQDEIDKASIGTGGQPMRFLLAKALLEYIGETRIPREYGAENKGPLRIVRKAAARP